MENRYNTCTNLKCFIAMAVPGIEKIVSGVDRNRASVNHGAELSVKLGGQSIPSSKRATHLTAAPNSRLFVELNAL